MNQQQYKKLFNATIKTYRLPGKTFNVNDVGGLDHSAIDSSGRTIWIADAHRDDGKRFIVHADEKLTAFLELESVICACGELV